MLSDFNWNLMGKYIFILFDVLYLVISTISVAPTFDVKIALYKYHLKNS